MNPRRLSRLLALAPVPLLGLFWGCSSAVRPRADGRDVATTCAGRVGADTAIYDTTQVSEPPKFRRLGRFPRYPEDLRAARLDGHVLVSVVIDANGLPEPGSIRIIRGTGNAFDAEAIATTRSVVYWPGCKGDSAVRVRLTFPVDFRITSGGP